MGRRDFVRGAALSLAAAAVVRPLFAQTTTANSAPPMNSSQGTVPMRDLGKTGVKVSAMGIGGFHLGSAKDQQEVNEIVAGALDAGVNFFDNAWEYHEGDSETRLG